MSLAGIFQSAHLIQQLSELGKCDSDAFNTCLQSILDINPTSLIKIYGNNEKNLSLGLKILVSILSFSHASYSSIELIKCILNMIIIEKKLKKNSNSISSLKKNLSIISHEYYINNDINMLTIRLAQLYLKTISSLGSRILIKGTKNFLQNPQIQEKIRCLLLSGIRSIVLWKQFGGSQIKLIYSRYYIIKTAKKILYNLKNTS